MSADGLEPHPEVEPDQNGVDATVRDIFQSVDKLRQRQDQYADALTSYKNILVEKLGGESQADRMLGELKTEIGTVVAKYKKTINIDIGDQRVQIPVQNLIPVPGMAMVGEAITNLSGRPEYFNTIHPSVWSSLFGIYLIETNK